MVYTVALAAVVVLSVPVTIFEIVPGFLFGLWSAGPRRSRRCSALPALTAHGAAHPVDSSLKSRSWTKSNAEAL